MGTLQSIQTVNPHDYSPVHDGNLYRYTRNETIGLPTLYITKDWGSYTLTVQVYYCGSERSPWHVFGTLLYTLLYISQYLTWCHACGRC